MGDSRATGPTAALRNNVLKLWTFVMEDLKTLGAKKLFPGLGTGSVNHVSIRSNIEAAQGCS